MVALLGSGGFYYADVKEGEGKDDKISRHILDEKEYTVMFEGLNGDSKYININGDYYFWGRIYQFGPIKFEKDVLDKFNSLKSEELEFIKKRIKKGVKVNTLEQLKSELSFYYS